MSKFRNYQAHLNMTWRALKVAVITLLKTLLKNLVKMNYQTKKLKAPHCLSMSTICQFA